MNYIGTKVDFIYGIPCPCSGASVPSIQRKNAGTSRIFASNFLFNYITSGVGVGGAYFPVE